LAGLRRVTGQENALAVFLGAPDHRQESLHFGKRSPALLHLGQDNWPFAQLAFFGPPNELCELAYAVGQANRNDHQTTLSMVEKISAVTLRVANMAASVRFYKEVLGLEIAYRGEGSNFTSRRTKDGDTILNLEHGSPDMQLGRLIFHVSDVDRFWAYLTEKGFHPDRPQDASWGERYFPMRDPDGHELSFARPISKPAADVSQDDL
jgi:catechol 2,3-dioxygenase-like lactoylglutathione lyase family enzyme